MRLWPRTTSLPSLVKLSISERVALLDLIKNFIVADFSAQAIVNTCLEKYFPADPIVGEEDSKDLQGDVGKPLREKVLSLTNGVLSDNEKLSEQQVRGRAKKEKKRARV